MERINLREFFLSIRKLGNKNEFMQKEIKKYIKYIEKNLLYISLIILFILLFSYVFSSCFRFVLYFLNIEPNFLVVFITAITLIFSAIENKKERKYNFNLNLKNSVEEKAAIVIGKLFIMMNDSQNYLQTIKDIKNAIEKNKKFVDMNNVLSLDLLKKDRELVGSYIVIYFSQYIQNDWNLMVDKINKIGTNCSMAMTNYNENYNLINTAGFENETLSNIDNTIKESEILNEEIYELTEKMKNTLLSIIVENNNKMKEKYIN